MRDLCVDIAIGREKCFNTILQHGHLARGFRNVRETYVHTGRARNSRHSFEAETEEDGTWREKGSKQNEK